MAGVWWRSAEARVRGLPHPVLARRCPPGIAGCTGGAAARPRPRPRCSTNHHHPRCGTSCHCFCCGAAQIRPLFSIARSCGSDRYLHRAPPPCGADSRSCICSTAPPRGCCGCRSSCCVCSSAPPGCSVGGSLRCSPPGCANAEADVPRRGVVRCSVNNAPQQRSKASRRC